MAEITCCQKGLVYTFLGLNIFLSFLICFLLSLATYDTIFLDWYQYMYLVVAYMVWLLLFCTYVAKLVLILIGKLPSKYIILTWMVLNIPATVFFLIAFIFDLVMLDNGSISWDIYIVVFVFVFILFLVFTGFDFFLLKTQIAMGENNGNKNNNNNINIDNKAPPGKTTQIMELNNMKSPQEVKVLQKKEEDKEMISQNEKMKGN